MQNAEREEALYIDFIDEKVALARSQVAHLERPISFFLFSQLGKEKWPDTRRHDRDRYDNLLLSSRKKKDASFRWDKKKKKKKPREGAEGHNRNPPATNDGSSAAINHRTQRTVRQERNIMTHAEIKDKKRREDEIDLLK